MATVVDEGLAGCTDAALFEGCIAEQRVLITLDLGFGSRRGRKDRSPER